MMPATHITNTQTAHLFSLDLIASDNDTTTLTMLPDGLGSVRVDAYGGVLTNTLPVTLTQGMAGLPDPDGGLTYLGNGRYYDPMLGRPLQPNPTTAPPSLPQALNRYAATLVGQPGVLNSSSHTNITTISLVTSVAKSSLAETAGRSAWGPLGKTNISIVAEGQTLIHVKASRTALGRAYKAIQNWGGTLVEPSSLESISANYQLHEAIFGLGITDKTAADLISEAKLPTRGGYKATVGFNAVDELVEISRTPRFPQLASLKFGLATDVVLGVGFQLYQDSSDPFLSTRQRAGRIGVAGLGGGISAGVGYGTAALFAPLLCGPSAPVCLSAALVGVVGSGVTSYVWGNYLQPYIFEARDLNSTRNLAPLY